MDEQPPHGTIDLWILQDGSLLGTILEPQVLAVWPVAFSPGGQELLTGSFRVRLSSV